MEAQQLVPTSHGLLRPDQVDEMHGERDALHAKMRRPELQDKAAAADQLRRLERQLETQSPKPFASDQIDAAVKREAQLKDEIRQGMLSHEEMRKNPPGAVDRHREWEGRNKQKITEWQNIQRRLNAGSDAREVASIEAFRPTHSTMNLDGAQIPGQQFFLNPPGSGLVVVFSDEEIRQLKEMAPDVAVRLPTLSNEQRAELKTVLKAFQQEQAA